MNQVLHERIDVTAIMSARNDVIAADSHKTKR